MGLSEFAVKRPVTTFMFFLAIVLIGGVSFFRLSIDMLPEIEFPSITVMTTYEGVGPEEIETLITKPIEASVSTVQGIERIDSISQEGRSRIQILFTWGTDLETAANDVRSAVERIRDVMPVDAKAPVVFKFDLSSFPILMTSMSGSLDSWRLRQLAEDAIMYRLERVPGVASVDIRGGDKREIHVELNTERLLALNLTAAEVVSALARDNINVPAGKMREQGKDVIVRALGEYQTLSQIGKVVVAQRGGRMVKVEDIATVRDGFEEATNLVYLDGEPGIRITISKQSGANTVAVSDAVQKEIARINAEYPNLEIKVIFDTADYIRNSIRNVEQGILFGATLALLVLFFFLRDFRATTTIAVSIPVAVIGTFALLYLNEFTLNMISFGGLALGIGMIVDNSIVILENIQRHREAGASRVQAAIKGSREVSTAIIASTITTICIFVPVLFQEGFAGIFFSEMAYVVTFALLCALAAALTLVPVIASLGRESDNGNGNGNGKAEARRRKLRWLEALQNAYGRLLGVALQRRRTVYLLSFALLFGALALAPRIGSELMAEGDQGDVRIDAELPVGTPLEATIKVVEQIQERVRELVPEARTIMGIAGSPGYWSTAGANGLMVRVRLVDLDQRDRSDQEIANVLRRNLSQIPDLNPRVRAGEGFFLFRALRGGGERLSVDVRGHDLAVSARLAEDVMTRMREIEGVTDVDVDRKEGNREAVVRFDADRVADLGLTVGFSASEISTYVLGKPATYLRQGGDEFTIRVWLAEETREFAEQLDSLPLVARGNKSVKLGDIAQIERIQGPVSIRRLNQERIVTVSGGFSGRDFMSIVEELQNAVSQISVPEGYSILLGGESAEQSKAFRQLLVGLILAIVLVYMVMASLFESLLHPFVMLLAIPFALIGIILSLVLTGTTLNINSFLGTIVLVGVVVNNAIVLVDYINLLRREQGMELLAAVTEAGRRRLRPILMTTLTTSLALFPVALGLGEGSETQAPLARVVVGGLLSSTLITLVFIPCLYVTLETFLARRAEKRAQVQG